LEIKRCDKCSRRAIIYQRYSGRHLCLEHFDADVHRKVRENLRQTALFGRARKIVLGLDGGRRSASLAHVLKDIFLLRRDIDLLAVVIDEKKSNTPAAKDACAVAERLGIPFVLKSLDSSNRSIRALSEEKKEILFCAAQENEADIVATGEDLDDEALDIFIRYLQGDVQGNRAGSYEASDLSAHARGGAHAFEVEGTWARENVSWIKPLRRIPEKEVRLYAIVHDLGYPEEKVANDLHQETKKQLLSFDRRHPGTCYSLLRGWERFMSPDGASRGKAFK
jgi:tRNA(Ile)-lysidine synthase TilS/MesJ